MLEYVNAKIQDIISEIKEVEEMIQFHLAGDDPADPIMADQFRNRKNKLLKELLSELSLSGVSFKDTNSFVQRISAYLEKTDKAATATKELKSNLEEVALMLRA